MKELSMLQDNINDHKQKIAPYAAAAAWNIARYNKIIYNII